MSPQEQIEQIKGIESLEKLLEFRNDAVIEEIPECSTLFKVSFLDGRFWRPSITVMNELKVDFCGSGIGSLGHFVQLSTHRQNQVAKV